MNCKQNIVSDMTGQCRCPAGKASAVGDKPGVTRAVLTSIRVSNRPLVYLIDTPGVMVPNIADMHVGLKLALCCKDARLHIIDPFPC